MDEKLYLALLQKTNLFKKLPADHITDLISQATLIKKKSNAFFFMQGDPAKKVFTLVDGQVKLHQISPDGQQVILGYISTPTDFGLLAVLNQTSYPISAQAVGECIALAWDSQMINNMLRKSHQLTLNALDILAQHMRDYQQQIQDLATQRVERRIARALLRLAQQSGRKTDNGVEIKLPLSRQDLAEMTGTTLFTVSRTLKKWETGGLIISKRQKVIIRYPHGLVSIAEDLSP